MDIDELLLNLNLAGTKAKVYTAVLKAPGSTAADIVRLSGAPQNKIYQILQDLERQHLIFPNLVRPYVYWPRDVREILTERQVDLREKIHMLTSLKSKVGTILLELQKSETGDQTTRLPNGQVAIIKVEAGTEAQVFRTLCQQLDATEKAAIFLGDLEDFVVGLKYGVGNVIERLVSEKHIECEQVIGINYEVFQPQYEKFLQVIQNRAPLLHDRKIHYLMDVSKFGIGLVLIDDDMTGILIKNPILHQFKMGIFIESQFLVQEFKSFIKSLHAYFTETLDACINEAKQRGLI